MGLLLLLAFSSVLKGITVAQGLDFAVSPEPVSFTIHPQSEIALEGTNIILRCAARIVNIGGFQEPLDTNIVPWRRYEICWEFLPAGDEYIHGGDFPEEYCVAKDNLQVSNIPATEEINSTLTIDAARMKNSGAYRCMVKDWQLKYASYHGLVHVIPQEEVTESEITVASSLAAVRLPCSNQTGGAWLSQYQTVKWSIVDRGITKNIRNDGYIMSNGDLVLYWGFPSCGVHLVCDQHWSSTLGLPLANRSYAWRIQVSENAAHDNMTEDVLTTWLGDEVDIFCNLPLKDNETVSWYHGNNRLTPDGSNGYTADLSGTVLHFVAQSASSEGLYTCVVGENGRRTTHLVLGGRTDLSRGVSAVDQRGKTHFIGTGDATKVLDCNTPEDPEDEVLLYEWIVDGVRVNSSSSSLSTNHAGAYVCYLHLREETLTAVHRVLPFGYLNPITQFVYPRTEVVGGTTSDPIVRLYFSWQPPEVLGGLTEDDIEYRVRLITENGESVADDVSQDLHFERNFSGIGNITTRMSIDISAESRGSNSPSSLSTHIPNAAVLDWYRFEIKVYCNSTQLDFVLEHPLKDVLEANNIYYYVFKDYGYYYFLGRTDEPVTSEYLQQNGRLSEFKSSNPILPSFYGKGLVKKTPLWGSGQRIHRSILKGDYNSIAVAFLPAFALNVREKYFFLRHFQESDYYICNFEDPPQISFADIYIELEEAVDVHTVYLSLNKPSNSRFLAHVVSDNISNDVLVEPSQLLIPYNITPTYGQVVYTLTVDEDYDNLVTVGRNDSLWVEIPHPPSPTTHPPSPTTHIPSPTPVGSTSPDISVLVATTTLGSLTALVLIVIATVGLCIICLYTCMKSKVRLTGEAMQVTTIKSDGDKQLVVLTFEDSPPDNVTQYEICSLVSYGTDSINCDEGTDNLQPTSPSPLNTDSSKDYSLQWTGMVADGYDTFALGNVQSNTALAYSPTCGARAVYGKTLPDGVQVTDAYIADSTITAKTGAGERTFSSSDTSRMSISTYSSTVCEDTSLHTSGE